MSSNLYKFLIVEDNETHQNQIKMWINEVAKQLKIRPVFDCVDTYLKALNRIKRYNYKIIIIDQKIPGGRGHILVEKIRKRILFQRIIFMTAYHSKKLQDRIKLARISAYIQKKGKYGKFFKQELEDILKYRINCFIIIPYSQKYLKFYSEVLEPLIIEMGFEPILAKNIFKSDTLIQNIKNGLNNSAFVIADLSEQNANVFYETGLSHQIPKPTILITRNSKNVPSDLKDKRYLSYKISDLDEFKEELFNKISNIELEQYSVRK